MKVAYPLVFLAFLSIFKIFILLKGASEGKKAKVVAQSSILAFGIALVIMVLLPLWLLSAGHISSQIQIMMLGPFVATVILIIIFSRKAL